MTSDAENLSSKTITDEHLPGYAELYDRLRETQEPDDMAQALEAEAARHVLPVQATRGVPTPFKAMVDFLRGRKHVQDLGEHVLEVAWLEFHVPRNSTGALKWKTSQSDEVAFNLNVFGSGLGSGRSISWSVESDIPARSICLKFIQQLNVQVQLYLVKESGRERYETSADVLSSRGRQLIPWVDCPYCASTVENVDEFDFEKGQIIDLRQYDSKYTETFTQELKEPLNASVGLTLPLPGAAQTANVGISFKREAHLSCTLVYEFAKGLCYQAYWPVGRSTDLPYWSSTE
jgi:hypothetical protein